MWVASTMAAGLAVEVCLAVWDMFWPRSLAVLELHNQSLTLRLRPRFLSKLISATSLEVEPGDTISVRPVRSNASWQGIEVIRQGEQSCYFWTFSRGEIMAALATAGFKILPDEAPMPRW